VHSETRASIDSESHNQSHRVPVEHMHKRPPGHAYVQSCYRLICHTFTPQPHSTRRVSRNSSTEPFTIVLYYTHCTADHRCRSQSDVDSIRRNPIRGPGHSFVRCPTLAWVPWPFRIFGPIYPAVHRHLLRTRRYIGQSIARGRDSSECQHQQLRQLGKFQIPKMKSSTPRTSIRSIAITISVADGQMGIMYPLCSTYWSSDHILLPPNQED